MDQSATTPNNDAPSPADIEAAPAVHAPTVVIFENLSTALKGVVDLTVAVSKGAILPEDFEIGVGAVQQGRCACIFGNKIVTGDHIGQLCQQQKAHFPQLLFSRYYLPGPHPVGERNRLAYFVNTHPLSGEIDMIRSDKTDTVISFNGSIIGAIEPRLFIAICDECLSL
jgi:hypothetical protein